MVSVEEDVFQWWGLREGGGDPITSKWPGVSSVIYPASTVCIYIAIVLTYRHKVKTSKGFKVTPPVDIKGYMIAYNLFQVFFSAYIFMETLLTAWDYKYDMWCEPPHSTLSESGRRMAIASWLFYISKYIDLMDTLFMIIKGNNHQITVLHVFHHSSMVVNSWMGIRHAPTGHSFFIHLANSFVHMNMYSYYFLSSFGQWIKPFLWWKTYLTQMQIIQFFLMFGHMFNGFYNGCPLPRRLVKMVLVYLIIIIGLFVNFYVQTYRKGSDKKSTKAKLR